MAHQASFPLVAVDIGNSRIKLGLFERRPSSDFPEPTASLSLEPDWNPAELVAWLPTKSAGLTWLVASVNRAAATRLLEWLRDHDNPPAKLLTVDDLPLMVDVERPDLVGMDRLVNAVAANRLRDPARPAIVLDLGSALTVDLVSPAGVFLGGAIAPGIAMSARALHQFTDLLPRVTMSELAEPPDALGTSTVAALRSGLYWGAVGAMRELIARLSEGREVPDIFLTGGAAPAVARLLNHGPAAAACYVPHLTLGGIALVAGG